YRVLAGLAARDGLLPGPRAVAARMDAQWPGLVDEGGVLFALDVFEELQLLRRLADGRFELVRSPGRVDVGSSLRYNDGVKTKQLFGEYSRVALEASPAHLIALAAERSSMDGFAGTGAGSAGLAEAWGYLKGHYHGIEQRRRPAVRRADHGRPFPAPPAGCHRRGGVPGLSPGGAFGVRAGCRLRARAQGRQAAGG